MNASKALVFLLLFTVFSSNVNSSSTENFYLLQSYLSNGCHPNDEDPIGYVDDHTTKAQVNCYITPTAGTRSEEMKMIISQFYIVKIHSDANGDYDAVGIHFVPEQKLYSVSISISGYGSATEGILTQERTFYYASRSAGDRIRIDYSDSDDYGSLSTSSTKKFFFKNTDYKIVVSYKISQDASADVYHQVYFVREGDPIIAQFPTCKLYMYYGGNDPTTTFDQFYATKAGVTPEATDGTDVTKPEEGTTDRQLTVDNIFSIGILLLLGSVLVQIGFSFFVKFQSFAGEFGGFMIICIGFTFIFSALAVAVDVVEGALGVFKVMYKPVNWVKEGLSDIWGKVT